MDKKIELEEYDKLHTLDSENNYGIELELDSELILKHEQIAEYTYNNYDKLTIEELKELISSCLTDKQIKHLILEHELKYYNINSVNNLSLDDFSKLVKHILNRYQCKAGGFLIEDNIWTLHTYQSKEHDVKKNELLFENSIDLLDIENNETQIYLDRLEKRLNMIATNITVDIRYKTSKKDNLVWILIWCTDKNIKKPKICL